MVPVCTLSTNRKNCTKDYSVLYTWVIRKRNYRLHTACGTSAIEAYELGDSDHEWRREFECTYIYVGIHWTIKAIGKEITNFFPWTGINQISWNTQFYPQKICRVPTITRRHGEYNLLHCVSASFFPTLLINRRECYTYPRIFEFASLPQRFYCGGELTVLVWRFGFRRTSNFVISKCLPRLILRARFHDCHFRAGDDIFNLGSRPLILAIRGIVRLRCVALRCSESSCFRQDRN